MNVIEIVKQYLIKNKLDGLLNTDGDCACMIEDLSPGDCLNERCQVGRMVKCNCGDHDWHIEQLKRRK